jgi:plastocyanin
MVASSSRRSFREPALAPASTSKGSLMQRLHLVGSSAFGLALVGALALTACSSASTPVAPAGSGSGSGAPPAGATITISDYTFSPDPITVAAGTTITVVNKDTMIHSATSEVAAKDYVQGKAKGGFSFNANVSPGSTGTIVVPSGLASGTSLPYYCTVHLGTMKNPDPTIVIK